ncbi:MAG: transglycosylase SLT domain-containing protein [Candidatus Woesearchaeota archaeon]
MNSFRSCLTDLLIKGLVIGSIFFGVYLSSLNSNSSFYSYPTQPTTTFATQVSQEYSYSYDLNETEQKYFNLIDMPEVRAMLITIARHESNYNFSAQNKITGAYGFCQIMPSTNKGLIKRGFSDSYKEQVQLAKCIALLDRRTRQYFGKPVEEVLPSLTYENFVLFLENSLQCEWAALPGRCLEKYCYSNQYNPKNFGFNSFEEAQKEAWAFYIENLNLARTNLDIFSHFTVNQ